MQTERQRYEQRQYDAATRWDDELDMLGTNAPLDQLAAHLERAPEGTEQRDFLAGYLAGRMIE